MRNPATRGSVGGFAAALAFAAAAAVAASPGAPAAASAICPPRPADNARLITRPRWLADATVTEYYPVRESWVGGGAR